MYSVFEYIYYIYSSCLLHGNLVTTLSPTPWSATHPHARWEKNLKSKVVSGDIAHVTEESDKDGKVICVAEIIDPVDVFFTPFCVHAINKLVNIGEGGNHRMRDSNILR